MSPSFGVDTPKAVERVVDVVEVEGDGYALYCKRGRRGLMEDRYSAVVDVHGDSTQVCTCYVNSDFVFPLYSEENRGK